MNGSKALVDKCIRTMGIASIVLVLVAAGLLLSMDFWKMRASERASKEVIADIERGVSEIKLTALAPEIEGEDEDWLAMQGLEELLGQQFQSPEELEKAQKLADANSLTAIGTLEIPKISLKLPVLQGTTKIGLRYGAGWFSGSAKPGQQGNCMMFGHRMKAKGRMFNRLNEMAPGDVVNLADMQAQLYVYKVVEVIQVLPKDLFPELFKHTSGRYLSLITCTPLGVGSHRLIILCEMVDKAA